MRGVILAGGRAHRLRPLSLHTNKHLLPVHDRPLLEFPLTTLVTAGVTRVLIVTNADHIGSMHDAIGDGSRFGCQVEYTAQGERLGTGTALMAAQEFVGRRAFAAILGDNIFTEDISAELAGFADEPRCQAKVFVHRVADPGRFGVAIFHQNRIVDVIEKPEAFASNIVTTGLSLFKADVFERLPRLRESSRGEYELTDVLAEYAREGVLGHAFVRSTWMDVGTLDSLAEARAIVQARGIAGADRVAAPMTYSSFLASS